MVTSKRFDTGTMEAAMERRMLHCATLRSAGYDERGQRLEVEFASGELRTYKGVPPEVARRLLAAPNAEAFWEDRIAEEYPYETGRDSDDPQARAKLDALFGKQ
jgi:hypothetical protein